MFVARPICRYWSFTVLRPIRPVYLSTRSYKIGTLQGAGNGNGSLEDPESRTCELPYLVMSLSVAANPNPKPIQSGYNYQSNLVNAAKRGLKEFLLWEKGDAFEAPRKEEGPLGGTTVYGCHEGKILKPSKTGTSPAPEQLFDNDTLEKKNKMIGSKLSAAQLKAASEAVHVSDLDFPFPLDSHDHEKCMEHLMGYKKPTPCMEDKQPSSPRLFGSTPPPRLDHLLDLVRDLESQNTLSQL